MVASVTLIFYLFFNYSLKYWCNFLCSYYTTGIEWFHLCVLDLLLPTHSEHVQIWLHILLCLLYNCTQCLFQHAENWFIPSSTPVHYYWIPGLTVSNAGEHMKIWAVKFLWSLHRLYQHALCAPVVGIFLAGSRSALIYTQLYIAPTSCCSSQKLQVHDGARERQWQRASYAIWFPAREFYHWTITSKYTCLYKEFVLPVAYPGLRPKESASWNPKSSSLHYLSHRPLTATTCDMLYSSITKQIVNMPDAKPVYPWIKNGGSTPK